MALLWCDGFDHYGLNEDRMLDGVYAQYGDDGLTTALSATGTHSYACNSPGGLLGYDGLRKVLPTSVQKIGMAARFYFPSLPTTPYSAAIFQLFEPTVLDPTQLSFIVGVNGEIHIIRGQDVTAGFGNSLPGTLVASTDPLIVASAWNHIEIQAYIHDTQGWVRIAINGVHRYQITGVDTKNSASSSLVAGVGQGHALNNMSGAFNIDDYYIYDFTGNPATYTDWCPTVDGSGIATNYMGEWECIYLPPDGDTAEADWLPSTGTTGYGRINETTPDDSQYVYSTTAGDLSEYALTDLPVDITVIRGVQVIGRLSKSDSGPAMVKYGMKSVAATTDAAERPVTVQPTYWWDFVNVDPNSGSRWTRASLNAAWVRLTRSA